MFTSGLVIVLKHEAFLTSEIRREFVPPLASTHWICCGGVAQLAPVVREIYGGLLKSECIFFAFSDQDHIRTHQFWKVERNQRDTVHVPGPAVFAIRAPLPEVLPLCIPDALIDERAGGIEVIVSCNKSPLLRLAGPR